MDEDVLEDLFKQSAQSLVGKIAAHKKYYEHEDWLNDTYACLHRMMVMWREMENNFKKTKRTKDLKKDETT